jgi:hypothetical protein
LFRWFILFWIVFEDWKNQTKFWMCIL